jgi:hypothetical protein
MNKNDLFCHLGKDFKVDWDVESVLSKMNNYIVDETVGPDGEHYPVKNITYPCFQIYPSGVNTSHTFWKFFTDECINICDNLTILKNTIKHENINSVLVEHFINTASFEPRFVRLIECQRSVTPHVDLREYALNIGLKNSSNAITNVSESKDKKRTKDIPSYQYQMNDRDVVILNTHHAHWVDVIKDDTKRIIISYNLKV